MFAKWVDFASESFFKKYHVSCCTAPVDPDVESDGLAVLRADVSDDAELASFLSKRLDRFWIPQGTVSGLLATQGDVYSTISGLLAAGGAGELGAEAGAWRASTSTEGEGLPAEVFSCDKYGEFLKSDMKANYYGADEEERRRGRGRRRVHGGGHP